MPTPKKSLLRSETGLLQVTRAWIPAGEIQWALSKLLRHMSAKVGGTYELPAISEFKVLDDRGGSGHFWIQFDPDEVGIVAAKKILGKEFEVTLELK